MKESKACFTLFFILFSAVLSADELSDLRDQVNRQFAEYTDYVKRFSADDQHSKILYSGYQKSAKKLELLQKKKDDYDLVDFQVDSEIGFDPKKADSSKSLSIPDPLSDYRLAWLNVKFFEYTAALGLFEIALSKARVQKQDEAKYYFGRAYCNFQLAETERGTSEKRDFLKKALDDLTTAHEKSDNKYDKFVNSLKKKAQAALDYLELEKE
ncbi:MAG: hypothetical protein PHW04_08225 [Candidatus Wallbacteria bacterium]|nr:hypothetical protein [Candidatus Wallbacteria bacterium]